MTQQNGFSEGQAATLHALATIDFRNGDHNSAHEKLEAAVKIMQQIGDLAGEARTFHQLGFLAWRQGRLDEGLRLVALSFIILSSVGNSDAKKSLKNLSDMTKDLGYTQEQLDDLQRDANESYCRDRGWSLIHAAFS